LSWKKAVSVSLVLLLLILTIGNVKVVAPNNTPIEAIAFTSSQYTEHNPITITSNADLASQGFPGNGSASNPYLIEGYSIETSGECISISDTDVSVLIRNCLLTMGSIDCIMLLIYQYVRTLSNTKVHLIAMLAVVFQFVSPLVVLLNRMKSQDLIYSITLDLVFPFSIPLIVPLNRMKSQNLMKVFTFQKIIIHKFRKIGSIVMMSV